MSDELEEMDVYVEKYIKLRDFRSMKETEMKENLAKVDAEMEKLEVVLMTFLNKTHQESAKTAVGTFFKKTTTRCSVADWDVVWEFIQDNNLFHMLNHAVNKTAVEEYIKANNNVPPGVNVTREVTVSVNRPKTR